VKAFWLSVLALVVISAVAGGILISSNPDAAQANLSRHGATRL
jgi:hypothetical protein